MKENALLYYYIPYFQNYNYVIKSNLHLFFFIDYFFERQIYIEKEFWKIVQEVLLPHFGT